MRSQISPLRGFRSPFAVATSQSPATPLGLELGASSIKTQTGNLQVPGTTTVLKQSRTNLTNILTADNSFLAVQYYYDPDRDQLNNPFALLGSSPGGNVGRMTILFYPEATTSSNAALRQRFWIQVRRTTGSAYVISSGVQPRVRGWYWLAIRRTTGGVVTADIFSCADGTKVGDGAATGITQPLYGLDTWNQTHFYIGFAQDVAGEPGVNSAVGQNNNFAVGWDGGLSFIGIGDVAVSDADMQAIALGANPVTRIGGSNIKFGRRLRFAGGVVIGLEPIPGTADTTSATTVIGTFLPGGTPGRQDTTDYITLNALPDYYGFGVDPVTRIATVPFAGLVGGVSYSGSITESLLPDFRYRREVCYFNGRVWGRFISEAGVPVSTWKAVATVSAPGVTNGRAFTAHGRSAPAIKVLLSSQSQGTIFCNGTTLNNTLTDPALSISRQERGVSNTTSFQFQTRPDVGNLRVSDGLVEFAKTIRARVNGAVHFILNGVDGSNALDMLDDWSRTASGVTLSTTGLLTYAGSDLTIDLWQYFTTNQGEGAAFGSNILGAVYLGTGPYATANKLPNIRSASAKIVISPATRQAPTSAGPLDSDPNQTIGAVRSSMRAWAIANGATIGPEITDMRLAGGEGPHQDANSVRGNPRLGIRMAEGVNRALGVSTSQDPSIGTPRFVAGKAAFTLTATLPNAGSTLRVDDTATYGSNVQGFEISTDGTGVTWTRSGFTATISGGTVTVTKTTGDWSAVPVGNMRVRYATGSPFGFGTSVEASELIRGGLYDGTALEGGLGLPIIPMASTVVAEP